MSSKNRTKQEGNGGTYVKVVMMYVDAFINVFGNGTGGVVRQNSGHMPCYLIVDDATYDRCRENIDSNGTIVISSLSGKPPILVKDRSQEYHEEDY